MRHTNDRRGCLTVAITTAAMAEARRARVNIAGVSKGGNASGVVASVYRALTALRFSVLSSGLVNNFIFLRFYRGPWVLVVGPFCGPALYSTRVQYVTFSRLATAAKYSPTIHQIGVLNGERLVNPFKHPWSQMENAG